MRIGLVIGSVVAVVTFMGCGSSAQPEQTPPSTQGEGIQVTIDAAVAATLTAFPTSTKIMSEPKTQPESGVGLSRDNPVPLGAPLLVSSGIEIKIESAGFHTRSNGTFFTLAVVFECHVQRCTISSDQFTIIYPQAGLIYHPLDEWEIKLLEDTRKRGVTDFTFGSSETIMTYDDGVSLWYFQTG